MSPQDTTPLPHPAALLRSLCWSLGYAPPETLDAFSEAVAKYQRDILDTDEHWRPDEVLVRATRLTLLYDHWDDDQQDHVTARVELTSDVGEHRAAQIMYALSQHAAIPLHHRDHHFFEGLRLQSHLSSEDHAFYRVSLGS
jgi:hypothetical protein